MQYYYSSYCPCHECSRNGKDIKLFVGLQQELAIHSRDNLIFLFGPHYHKIGEFDIYDNDSLESLVASIKIRYGNPKLSDKIASFARKISKAISNRVVNIYNKELRK